MSGTHVKYSQEDFRTACASSDSISEAIGKLGMKVSGGSYDIMRSLSRHYGIPLPVWANRRNTRGSNTRRLSNEEFFLDGILRTSTQTRVRMRELGIAYECAIPECKIAGEWLGKLLTLEVDHINGNRMDNQLSNLRFLCPNCHTQTSTFGAKNKHRYEYCPCGRRGLGIQKDDPLFCVHANSRLRDYHRCLECGTTDLLSSSVRCRSCAYLRPVETKAEYPALEEMIESIKKIGYRQYGIELGVSDNAIRKYLKTRGVTPLPKREKSHEYTVDICQQYGVDSTYWGPGGAEKVPPAPKPNFLPALLSQAME